MANRYVDFSTGSSTNNGTTTALSWKDLNSFMTTEARTAGDICYVRANRTWDSATTLIQDEAGTGAAPIRVIGCTSVAPYDPWGDASTVRAVVDFAASAANNFGITRSFWSIENLDIKDVTSQSLIEMSNVVAGTQIKGCKISGAITGYGIWTDYNNNALIQNCEFVNNAIHVSGTGCGNILFDDCSFDGGAIEGTCYLGDVDDFAHMVFRNCSFGQSDAQSYVIYTANMGEETFFINCETTYGTAVRNDACPTGRHISYWQDFDGTYGDHRIYANWGTVSRTSSAVYQSDTHSIKMMPASTNCNVASPCTLNMKTNTPDYKLFCKDGVAKTITMYVRGLNWATYPTTTTLFLEAEYYDSSTVGTMTVVSSTDVLVDNTTWTPFSVTFTPHRDGYVRLKLKLGLYEDAATGIYVKPTPVVT